MFRGIPNCAFRGAPRGSLAHSPLVEVVLGVVQPQTDGHGVPLPALCEDVVHDASSALLFLSLVVVLLLLFVLGGPRSSGRGGGGGWGRYGGTGGGGGSLTRFVVEGDPKRHSATGRQGALYPSHHTPAQHNRAEEEQGVSEAGDQQRVSWRKRTRGFRGDCHSPTPLILQPHTL